jgi:hypothetical protein
MLLISMMMISQPVIAAREPHSASPLSQLVQANCGGSELVISGYGAARPLNGRAELVVADRPIEGDAVERLRSDLSHRRSVYRLEVLCGSSGQITLRINVGERQEDGDIRYQSGAALIRGNRLEHYTGLQASNVDTFWFR